MMTAIEKFQNQLLAQTRRIYYETPISVATEQAYLATPRHAYVKRYREWGTQSWHEINEDNLENHLSILYANRSLALFGDDDNDTPSTISQPSFVLRMLDMLQFEPGHIAFELGAGSAWNAALIGHLVGPAGRVYSLEIIPKVAALATETIQNLGIKNVHILEADGGEGYAPGAPYDRAIFAAGSYDLLCHFYEHLKDEGLLLMVVKSEGGGDNLFLLQKRGTYFEALDAQPCGFVQMTGKYKIDTLEPIVVETLLEKPGKPLVFRQGMKGQNLSFIISSMGLFFKKNPIER